MTAGEDVLTIGLNRAVALIDEKRAKRKSGRGADPGRALGDHPEKGGRIVVKSGRYGPYATHDGVNATLPADFSPETITLEQAVGLLEARRARGGKRRAGSKVQAAHKAAPKANSDKAPTRRKKEPQGKTQGAVIRPRR